jgi:cysteine desulfurase
VNGRVHLDWNAGAPLRPEARAAMAAAMDLCGNPSSVHAEGRAARAAVERARESVARLAGCDPERVVFTSGATEANAMALRSAPAALHAPTGHASLIAAAGAETGAPLPLDGAGRLDLSPGAALGVLARVAAAGPATEVAVAFEAANGETGAIEDPAAVGAALRALSAASGARCDGHCDATQAVGRVPFAFDATGLRSAALSAHKLGGPKGVGAFLCDDARPAHAYAMVSGGGQERGARAGTENVIGIAGFGAAAEAAVRDLARGVWERVAALRDRLEERLAEAAPDAIFVGRDGPRLPNTCCVVAPGWPGETQVIAMDLAGYAVSAGAACSSGKVRRSHVLSAMGFDDDAAAGAIRVSLGPTTTETEIDGFALAWTRAYARRRARAA